MRSEAKSVVSVVYHGRTYDTWSYTVIVYACVGQVRSQPRTLHCCCMPQEVSGVSSVLSPAVTRALHAATGIREHVGGLEGPAVEGDDTCSFA